jgi:hypothetical protein
MKHILDILALPSAMILIAYIAVYIKHRKEINNIVNEEKRKNPKKYYPKKRKSRIFTYPLSLWNDN